MANTRFLDLYGASETVVEEVRKEENLPQILGSVEGEIADTPLIAEQAVFEFLQASLPDDSLLTTDSGSFDYIAQTQIGKVFIITKHGPNAHRFLRQLRKERLAAFVAELDPVAGHVL